MLVPAATSLSGIDRHHQAQAMPIRRSRPKEYPVSENDRQTPDDAPDASDVVDGPIGSASLRDPATSGPMGADLDALEPIDDGDDEAEPDDARPIEAGEPAPESRQSTHERQDSARVGVDWERTTRDEG
jgi:hypothetical protein